METYALKKTRGRSYAGMVDWETGRLEKPTTNPQNASTFVAVPEAVDFAIEHGLSPREWKVVRL